MTRLPRSRPASLYWSDFLREGYSPLIAIGFLCACTTLSAMIVEGSRLIEAGNPVPWRWVLGAHALGRG